MAENTNTKKVSRGRLPSKRSINLVAVTEKSAVKPGIAIPAIVAIVLAALLLSKFAVLDRLTAVNRANAEVKSLQTQLAEGYSKIDEFGELTDQYAHYTYSDMTEEELNRVDRVEIVDLVQNNVVPGTSLNSWSVKGNQVELGVTADSLQEINQIAKQLSADKLVNFCTVTTAQKDPKTTTVNEETTTSDVVTGSIIVYLNDVLNEEGGN